MTKHLFVVVVALYFLFFKQIWITISLKKKFCYERLLCRSSRLIQLKLKVFFLIFLGDLWSCGGWFSGFFFNLLVWQKQDLIRIVDKEGKVDFSRGFLIEFSKILNLSDKKLHTSIAGYLKLKFSIYSREFYKYQTSLKSPLYLLFSSTVLHFFQVFE